METNLKHIKIQGFKYPKPIFKIETKTHKSIPKFKSKIKTKIVKKNYFCTSRIFYRFYLFFFKSFILIIDFTLDIVFELCS